MRERPTLSTPGDLTGFPVTRAPVRLHRVCRSDSRTWWFSSDGSGRFDLEPPEGTSYFATDLYAAIREATRLGPVTPRWLADREVRVVATPSDPKPRLAATTRKEAGRFGVTTELVTVLPYDLPRRWAAAFRDHRFDGIRHQLRHDPRARPSGVSLFGPAGVGGDTDGDRRPLEIRDLTIAGVRVVEPPHSAVLTILRP